MEFTEDQIERYARHIILKDVGGAGQAKLLEARVLVVGAGVIGLEMGSVWRRLGSEVKVVEFLDRIVPGIDAEVAKHFQRLLERQGMSFTLSSKVVGVEKKGGELIVAIEPASGGKPQFVKADVMLVATGRRPYTDGLGLDEAGVKRDKQGRIVTDGDFRTSVDTIWAIGDVREGAMLAHKAEDEAVAVALDDGEDEFVIAALAVRAGFSFDRARRIVAAESPRSVAALAWKAGCAMRFASQLQLRLGGIAPNQVLNPRGGTDYPLSDEEMDWQLDFFQSLAG